MASGLWRTARDVTCPNGTEGAWVTAEAVPILAPVDEQPAARGRRLAWSTAIFALATGLSRILGLVREIVASYYFGAAGKVNAFTVAFQVPNLVRSLVADAALSSAFVPVFSELLEKGEKKRAWRVASTLFWLMLLGLGALVALLIVIAPLVIAPFGDPGGDKELAIGLSRVLFPIVALLGVSGDDRRDPQQLRPVHRPGAVAGLLEPGDHPRPRARRPARRHDRRQALRLRDLDRDRHGDPGAAAGAVVAQARRAPPHGARLARPGRAPGLRADGAGDDRSRADQLQPRHRLDLRVAVDRPRARPDGDRQGLPRLHAPAGRVLGRRRDGALSLALSSGRAGRPGRLPAHGWARAAADRVPARAGERALGRARGADRAPALPARRVRPRGRRRSSPARSPPSPPASPSTGRCCCSTAPSSASSRRGSRPPSRSATSV